MVEHALCSNNLLLIETDETHMSVRCVHAIYRQIFRCIPILGGKLMNIALIVYIVYGKTLIQSIDTIYKICTRLQI